MILQRRVRRGRTRASVRGGDPRDTIVSRSKSQARTRASQVVEIKRISDISKQALSGATSISQLKDLANTFYRNNVNNVDPALRNAFRNVLRAEIRKKESEQGQKIERLTRDLNKFKAEERQADRLNQREREDAAMIKQRETEKIIKQIRDGKIISLSSAQSQIQRKGRIEFQKRSSELRQLKAEKINKRINFAIKDAAKRGSVFSVSLLKKRFGISTRKALEVQNVMTKNKKQLRETNVKQIQKDLSVPKLEAVKIERQINPERQATGFLTKAEAPKKWSEKLEKFRQKIIYDVQREQFKGSKLKPLKIVGGQLVLGGVGVVRGLFSVAKAITQPIKTVRNIIRAAKTPVQTIRAGVNEFRLDPLGTVAEYVTYSRVLGLAGKGVKRSPVGRYVQEEIFIRAQPKEIRVPVRKVIKAAKTQEAINPFKVKSIKKVDFFEVKALTKAEAIALEKALKNTDTVVFGSLASRTLSKKKTPIPKDVDLATSNVKTFSNKFIQSLPKNLQKGYKLKGEKVIRVSNGEALFDIKPLSRLVPDRSILTKKGFLPVSGYTYNVGQKLAKKLGVKQPKGLQLRTGSLEVPTQKIKKVGGIKLVGFGEQTTRKGLGTLQVIIEKNARRAKDPAAFIKSLEVQIKGLQKAKTLTPVGRAINKNKISNLNAALKVLKSKDFARLLDKKVPGLTKEFPILKKIPVKKLKAAISKAKIKPIKLPKSPKAIAKRLNKTSLPDAKKSFSQLPITKKVFTYSYLPKKLRRSFVSQLPSRLPSKLVSKLPRSVLSKLPPSRIPSKIPSRPPSKVPSRPPSKVPSRPPSKIPSKVPVSKIPSKPPSKIPTSRPPSKIPGRPPSKIPIIPVRPPKAPPSKIPRGINWRKKAKKGFSYIVNAAVSIGGKRKIIRLSTTANRGLKYMIRLIDNTTARSFDLIIIGISRLKDVARPSLAKFRRKISSNPKVLKVVEKSKFAIDTVGEKRGLKLGKVIKGLKKKRSKPKKTKPKRKKGVKKRASNNKVSKSKTKKGKKKKRS